MAQESNGGQNRAASGMQKAKTPIIAGGAALAGLAGGFALRAGKHGRHRVLGVPMLTRKSTSNGLVGVARQLGSATQQLGELTAEVRQVREQTENSRRRSPVEVVLEGLTARRGKA